MTSPRNDATSGTNLLSRMIEPGICVEKIMLTTNTPTLRIFPARPDPHSIVLLAHESILYAGLGGVSSEESPWEFGRLASTLLHVIPEKIKFSLTPAKFPCKTSLER
jgi:hypothetical protein